MTNHKTGYPKSQSSFKGKSPEKLLGKTTSRTLYKLKYLPKVSSSWENEEELPWGLIRKYNEAITAQQEKSKAVQGNSQGKRPAADEGSPLPAKMKKIEMKEEPVSLKKVESIKEESDHFKGKVPEKLLGKKVFNSKTLYKVKWKDLPEDSSSWKLEDEIPVGLIRKFNHQGAAGEERNK